MANGYDASAFPVSYNDPTYAQADQAASAAIGIPAQWLNNIRTKGEKSNADQISSAGAATPYQITPSTRKAIIDQTGVDPYLNPSTAAYGAAYLLKQSLDRNGGNPVLATAEYHGGTDQSNWGTKTMAYVKRVTGASPNNSDATPSWSQPQANGFQLQPPPTVGSAPSMGDSGPSQMQQVFNAYQNGKMSPDDAKAFEQDVQAGRIVLPDGMKLQPAQQPQGPQGTSNGPTAPQQLVDAFNDGKMSPEDAKQFQNDVQSGNIGLPEGAALIIEQPGPPTAGHTAGVAARGYLQGLADTVGGVVDKAKNVIDMPVNALNAAMQGGGPLNAIDQLMGTHLAPQTTPTSGPTVPGQQQAPLAGAPQAAPNIPSIGESATALLDRAGVPTAQTPAEHIVQAGAQGAGALTVPVPGMALKAIPGMIVAGAGGGVVGEAVHQATGSQALGMAANLLTTALSPAAASRVMSAITKELPSAAATAERVEPTMQASAGQTSTAQGRAAAASANPAGWKAGTETWAEPSTPTAAPGTPATPAAPAQPLATQPNPGTPAVANPAVDALQKEKASLIPVAANAPQKGDTSIQDQISSLEGRQFDSVADRTRALQAQGMKFSDARAAAEKQISGEMAAHQNSINRLQAQQAAQQDASRAAQRIQDIDQQLGQTPPTVPAQRSAIAQAAEQAVATRPRAAATPPASTPISDAAAAPEAATAAAAPAESAATASPGATAATTEAQAQTSASVNPSGSPLSSAAQQFMSPEELAAQTRRAVGTEGAPFGLGKNTARETLATQGAPDEETLAAAKRLGIDDNLQPDHLTSNQAYRELAQAIKSTPGSQARASEMEGLQNVAQRGMKVIDDAGGTRDLSDLSSQVKSQLMGTQQQLDQKAEGLYSELRSTVPAKTAAPADNVLSFIQQRADDLGSPKNLSPMEKMIQAKLTPKEVPITVNGQAVDPASIGMKAQTQAPNYALLDDVRRDIGNGLRNSGPFKDSDTGLLKALYGRISEDQRAALSNIPGALEKFDAARATVQMRKSIEDDLTSLYGKQLGDSIVGKLGTAVSALPKGDESKFIDLIKAVPASMRQQVTASGLAYAFGKATRNGELNFKTYADWMDGLKRNSGAFNAVMGNLPAETRQQLLDLAKVSRGISNATRETITTGRIMAAREELNARVDGVVGRVMNTARQAAVGHVGTAVAAGAAHVAGPIGAGLSHAVISALSKGKPDVMKAADELIVSPEFQALAKNGSAATPQTVKAAANSPVFRRFYDIAKAATAANDPNARERWLLGVITSSENEHTMNTNKVTNK